MCHTTDVVAIGSGNRPTPGARRPWDRGLPRLPPGARRPWDHGLPRLRLGEETGASNQVSRDLAPGDRRTAQTAGLALAEAPSTGAGTAVASGLVRILQRPLLLTSASSLEGMARVGSGTILAASAGAAAF